MTNDVTFILLPGAGLHGWIWDDVRPLLNRPAFVLDYPNRDRKQANDKLTLAEYVAHLENQIAALPPAQKLIVVGHSIGGVIGLALAEKLGARVAGFVGVSAIIPPDHRSLADTSSKPLAWLMYLGLRVFGTRPPDSAILKGLCGDLPKATADRIVREFAPEALAAYFTPVRNPGFAVPTLYVKTTLDIQVPPPVQAKFARNLAGAQVVELATTHMPMLTQPQLLAQHLNAFADML